MLDINKLACLQPPLHKYMIPRPPLAYLPPINDDADTRDVKPIHKISGMKFILEELAVDSLKLRYDHNPVNDPMPIQPGLKCINILNAGEQRKLQKKAQKLVVREAQLKHDKEKWTEKVKKMNEDNREDSFKTLFVGRLAYVVTETELQKEFGTYGKIKSIQIIRGKANLGNAEQFSENQSSGGVESEKIKSRGYAFIVFEREKDMKAAYWDADAKKIHGRRIVVDVQRAGMVHDFIPKRLGGHLGHLRADKRPIEAGRDAKYKTKEVVTGQHHQSQRKRSPSPAGRSTFKRPQFEGRPYYGGDSGSSYNYPRQERPSFDEGRRYPRDSSPPPISRARLFMEKDEDRSYVRSKDREFSRRDISRDRRDISRDRHGISRSGNQTEFTDRSWDRHYHSKPIRDRSPRGEISRDWSPHMDTHRSNYAPHQQVGKNATERNHVERPRPEPSAPALPPSGRRPVVYE